MAGKSIYAAVQKSMLLARHKKRKCKMSGEINEFSFSFRENFPRVMKGVCGSCMEDPLGECSLVRMADKPFFIVPENMPDGFREKIKRLFPEPAEKIYYALPASESAKNISETEKLCAFLYEKGCSRNSVLVACGGGTVTDSAGFAASVYMRGIRWISVPTTFLGQIDAGIGGKTGVNLSAGKNIIGSFWQPSAIVLETDFLSTLPAAELRSGAGELVKYALLMQPEEGRALREAVPEVLKGSAEALKMCVSICANMKLRLAGRDERDQFSIREKLNLGHTAGHAIEAMSAGKMSHGEAVAHGLRFAILLSEKKCLLPADKAEEMLALTASLALPESSGWQNDFGRFMSLVRRDKKAAGASNRFVLLRDYGITETAENIDESLLRQVYEEIAE